MWAEILNPLQNISSTIVEVREWINNFPTLQCVCYYLYMILEFKLIYVSERSPWYLIHYSRLPWSWNLNNILRSSVVEWYQMYICVFYVSWHKLNTTIIFFLSLNSSELWKETGKNWSIQYICITVDKYNHLIHYGNGWFFTVKLIFPSNQ